ncbi:MAG TPA: PAS domain S-box protein [Spirochaetota bacterium]|nr:PAS domain S-box protein [Spirochaetota bacterium]
MGRILDRYKIVIVTMLVLMCLSFIIIFYGILQTGTVFSHFFYIPIIIASLWWGRRGIFVAVILSVSLIAAHLILKPELSTVDDYIRALVFIVISVVVAILSERITRARERMRHFNLVLRSIRDINHLITKEKDLYRLLKGICDNLIKNRSYNYAWIALVDENSRLLWAAEAGLAEKFHPMADMLINGTMPLCAHRAVYQRGVIVIRDPSIDCAGCPLSSLYADQGKMTIRINPDGRLRGILSVSIPEDLITDRDEQVLFEEIADDIEYALSGIELRGEHEVTLEELQESEERFRSIIENAPFGYYRVDLRGLFEYINTEWERMFGLSRDDVIGRHFSITQSGEGRRQTEDQIGRVLAGETVRGEFGMRRKDGMMVYQTYYSQPLYHRGEIVGAEGFLNDITERKSAEMALRRSRRLLSQIVEGSPIPTFVIDEEHRITHWNRACEILTGFSSDDMIGTRRQWEPFYRVERPTLADIIISAVLAPQAVRQYEGEYRKSPVLEEAAEGERFFAALGSRGKWLSFTAALLRDAEGNISGAIETLQDVTERKRAEDEKIRAYTELEQIFNSTPVGMRVIDRNYSILHLNRRFMEMFDLDSRHFARSGQADWDREIIQADRVLMKRILAGERYVEYELRTAVNEDEAVFIVHASPYFSKDGNVIGVIENFTNITEMRSLQNGIMRIAEIERQRIGQDLHDGLGQNLTAVTFLIEALKEKTAERFKVGIPDIENIESMIRDAIVQTRSLSRMLSPVEMEKNGLRSALDEMASSTEKIFHVSCKIYQDGNFYVSDNQAATHLFYIAREAVTNSIKHGKASSIHIHLVANSEFLRIVIQDDGEGAQEKKNTGLGLRIMRYRAGIIGAEFQAGNREGGGFEVRVQMKQ